jgi:hypothetical protein
MALGDGEHVARGSAKTRVLCLTRFILHRAQDQMNNVAKFLESRGMPEQALEVATDADYRFELAVQLGRLETALQIAGEADSESKWKQLGELAMSSGKLDVRALCRPCPHAHFKLSRLNRAVGVTASKQLMSLRLIVRSRCGPYPLFTNQRHDGEAPLRPSQQGAVLACRA